MSKDIRKHTHECDEYQRTKTSTQSPAGELIPMPIPNRPWKSIGMDFLGPIPISLNGNDMILVIIDRLTKMAHFIPIKSTITSSQVADLFVEHIFRYHGMPHSIVSDRNPKFTANFWKNLNKSLGIDLLMSTAAHPQTDGQSEATVKVIQKLLRPFCLQDQDRETLLLSLEFAYNDTQHTSTGYTPFYLNYGYHSTGTHRLEETNSPHVEDRVKYLIRLQEAARDSIHNAQTIQEKYANKHRRLVPDIKVDDWVLLRRKKEDKRKLAQIADGPFKVIAV
jgi:Integrase core domain